MTLDIIERHAIIGDETGDLAQRIIGINFLTWLHHRQNPRGQFDSLKQAQFHCGHFDLAAIG